MHARACNHLRLPLVLALAPAPPWIVTLRFDHRQAIAGIGGAVGDVQHARFVGVGIEVGPCGGAGEQQQHGGAAGEAAGGVEWALQGELQHIDSAENIPMKMAKIRLIKTDAYIKTWSVPEVSPH